MVLLSVIGWMAAGCEAPSHAPVTAPTLVDRLVRAYPDLEGGRFVTIADFENVAHAELFRFERESPSGTIARKPSGGRKDTGTAALEVTFGSPRDVLVASNADATNWYLKRSWVGFDLLLMSVRSPRDDVAVALDVLAGPKDERFTTSTTIRLHHGWNQVRIDLADLGERIPLSNVNVLRFSVPALGEPVTLQFDDLILTANRKTLLGDPQGEGEGLYAQRVGRRWIIGSHGPGAFELVFARGQIVAWYNTAADPQRRRNLVWGTSLSPLPLAQAHRDGAGPLSVRSRVVELGPVRAVIECEWRPDRGITDGASGVRSAPFLRWVYTIDPTGQVFVSVTTGESSPASVSSPVGLAVSLAASASEGLRSFVSGSAKSARGEIRPAFATARVPASDAFLLFAVHDATGRVVMRRATKAENGIADRTTFVAEDVSGPAGPRSWACLLFVGSSSGITDEEAIRRAVAYTLPSAPRLELGDYVPVKAGRVETLGYDPAAGCFVIEPDRGRVRLILDGTNHPYNAPAFRILNPAHQDARVYVDQLIFDHVTHDTGGNVVFQLPFAVQRRVMVEVLFQR